jgi:hypothetical protein
MTRTSDAAGKKLSPDTDSTGNLADEAGRGKVGEGRGGGADSFAWLPNAQALLPKKSVSIVCVYVMSSRGTRIVSSEPGG